MAETAPVPTTPYQPVGDLCAELIGTRPDQRTVASWRRRGLRCLIGPKGSYLTSAADLVAFLEHRPAVARGRG